MLELIIPTNFVFSLWLAWHGKELPKWRRQFGGLLLCAFRLWLFWLGLVIERVQRSVRAALVLLDIGPSPCVQVGMLGELSIAGQMINLPQVESFPGLTE